MTQASDMDVSSLRQELELHYQEHLLSFWEKLTDDEKDLLYQDLRSIDFQKVTKIFHQSTPSTGQVFDDSLLEPLPDDVHESVSRSDASTLQRYREQGIKENTVSIFLLYVTHHLFLYCR
jgi:UDP-N-acetylglucosamine/UDP-N-acetylgalactosamine diphosphorylase